MQTPPSSEVQALFVFRYHWQKESSPDHGVSKLPWEQGEGGEQAPAFSRSKRMHTKRKTRRPERTGRRREEEEEKGAG